MWSCDFLCVNCKHCVNNWQKFNDVIMNRSHSHFCCFHRFCINNEMITSGVSECGLHEHANVRHTRFCAYHKSRIIIHHNSDTHPGYIWQPHKNTHTHAKRKFSINSLAFLQKCYGYIYQKWLDDESSILPFDAMLQLAFSIRSMSSTPDKQI